MPAIIDFFYGPLADDPHRVGKPLRDGFAGTYGAHRGSYRVLYEINEAAHADRDPGRRPRRRVPPAQNERTYPDA